MATHAVDDPSGGSHHQSGVRPNALHEANLLHSAFFGRPLLPSSSPSSAANNDANNADNNNTISSKEKSTTPKNERSCIGGHKETVFGISFSPDGKYLASASQDSTICIWDVASHRLAAKLSEGMDVKYECLRVVWMRPRDDNDEHNRASGGEDYLLASAGADGIARLWSGSRAEGKLTWRPAGELDHHGLGKEDGVQGGASEGEEDRPQIYALQFVQSEVLAPNMDILLSSTDNTIYLWNIVKNSYSTSDDGIKRRKFLPHLSMRFSHLDDGRHVNKFGGERNPANELYVFDASYSESNDLLGVALSDGTCRVLPLAGGGGSISNDNQCVLSLPPGYFPGTRGGHLTALSWDRSGTRLATCIASGRVVLWSLQIVDRDGLGALYPSCIAVLEGGHDIGRPLFGVKYCGGKNEDLLVTWGVDGKVCMWDSYSVGEVISPLCTLVSHSKYPIYTLDVTYNNAPKAQAGEEQKLHLAVGGGEDGGFLGVPVYLYDI